MWILSQLNSPYKNMLTCKYNLGRNTALTGSGPAYLQIYYGSWISRLLGTSLVAQRLRHHTPSVGGPGVPSLIRELDPPAATKSSIATTGGSDGKESACNMEDPSLILGWEDPPWRRNWQPTPIFLPGKSHGQRSLVGYSRWGRKELDTTERLTHTHTHTHTHTRSHVLQLRPGTTK